ncbi:hypothetical protein Esti_001644 [Eimeria stiedai]
MAPSRCRQRGTWLLLQLPLLLLLPCECWISKGAFASQDTAAAAAAAAAALVPASPCSNLSSAAASRQPPAAKLQQQHQRGAFGLCMRFYKARAIRALAIPEIEREVLLARQSVSQLRLLQRGGLVRRHRVVHARRLLRQLLTVRMEREATSGPLQQREQQQQLQQQQRQRFLQDAQQLQQMLRRHLAPETQQQLQQLQQELEQQQQQQDLEQQQQQQVQPENDSAAAAIADNSV